MKKSLSVLALLLPFLAFSQKDLNTDKFNVTSIGFYNLENLFDTIDNPTTRDEDFLPGGLYQWNTYKYTSKQANMAKVISQMGTEFNPDGLAILGVAEVENRKVLEDLTSQPALKSRQYKVIHFDSPDERGIDCGLLYNPKYFKPSGARPFQVNLNSPADSVKDYTRDVLYVTGLLNGDPIHLMVNHWPSRLGGESASAARRAKAAAVCRHIADSLSMANPKAKIIIMGDLNDDPINASVTKVLGAKSRTKDLENPGDLYNPMMDLYKSGTGTLAYRDAWNLFDQMIISHPLADKKVGGWQLYKALIFRQPWLLQTEGGFKGYTFRTFNGDVFINGYSDHLPVYLVLLKKK